jgi:squalene-hopene/tetraprenyl-beta-curcumene cyclase
MIGRLSKVLLIASAIAVAPMVSRLPRALADEPATQPASVQAAPPVTAANVGERASQMIEQGLAFIKTQQKDDGDFAPPQMPPGLSALALRAFVLDPPYSTKDAFLKKGYDKLISFQVGSGGIFKDGLATYNTAIAVSTLAAANDPSLKPELDKAVGYLRGMQWTDTITGPHGESIKDPKKASFEGGFGYGHHSRPDLSNTQFALDALHDAGVKPDDPAFQEAIKFVTRCQNFSETNDQAWAGNDGGFIYSAGDAGDSEAGDYTAPDGKKMWRSYGSMTYAGFKSLIYAGLGKQDPRVKAALGWIKSHWTLDENPGLRDKSPDQALHGLFYYFHAMSRALVAYGEPVLVDATGTPHDWRVEMTAKIASLEHPDGSWAGEKRWMEDNQVLSTAYNVLALEEIRNDLKDHPAK